MNEKFEVQPNLIVIHKTQGKTTVTHNGLNNATLFDMLTTAITEVLKYGKPETKIKEVTTVDFLLANSSLPEYLTRQLKLQHDITTVNELKQWLSEDHYRGKNFGPKRLQMCKDLVNRY